MAQWLMLAVFGFSIAVFLAAFLAATSRARLAMVLTGGASIVGLTCMLTVGVAISGTAGAISGTVVGMTLAAIALAYPVRIRTRAGLERATRPIGGCGPLG